MGTGRIRNDFVVHLNKIEHLKVTVHYILGVLFQRTNNVINNYYNSDNCKQCILISIVTFKLITGAECFKPQIHAYIKCNSKGGDFLGSDLWMGGFYKNMCLV